MLTLSVLSRCPEHSVYPNRRSLTHESESKSSYLAANFMPQSSEQYLELGLDASTQLGPRHWRCPVLSRRSPFSLYLVLSLCFCFCLWRRDSFWRVQKEAGSRPDVTIFATSIYHFNVWHTSNNKDHLYEEASLTFLSNFFSRLLTCFTFTAFLRMTGLKGGSSSSSLPHAWVRGEK